MEIKKHLKIMLAKSLFGPNRLLFFADTTPAATTAPEELESNYNAASELISIISSTDGFEGMDKNILLDPKKNPFYFKLLELGARFKSTDGALDFLLPVKKDGKVTLKYAATDPSVIEGEEYVALFWQEIQPEMHRALSKVPGTPDFKTSLIAELVNAGNPAMMEFAIAISKNGGDVDSDTTGRFLTAINTLPKVKALVVATSKHEKSSDYVNDKIADDKYELGQELKSDLRIGLKQCSPIFLHGKLV